MKHDGGAPRKMVFGADRMAFHIGNHLCAHAHRGALS